MFFLLFVLTPPITAVIFILFLVLPYNLLLGCGVLATMLILFFLSLPLINTWLLESIYKRHLNPILAQQTELFKMFSEKIENRSLKKFRISILPLKSEEPQIFYSGWFSSGIIICRSIDEVALIKPPSRFKYIFKTFYSLSSHACYQKIVKFLDRNRESFVLFPLCLFLGLILTFFDPPPLLVHEVNK